MKINELRILIQEIIAEETSLDEIHILYPGLDNEKATQSYRDTEDAYKAGYLEGYNHAINIHNTSTNEGIFGPSKKDTADFEAEYGFVGLCLSHSLNNVSPKAGPNTSSVLK